MKTGRLRKKSEFDAVFANGKKTKGRIFSLYAFRNGEARTTDMGAAIAKKFEPSAVKRNYIKRVINAFFREHGEEIRKKYKIIVRLGRSTRDIKKRTLSRELRNDLKALLEKAGILK